MKVKVVTLLLALLALTTFSVAQGLPDNALIGQARNIIIPLDGPFSPSVGGGSCFPLTGAATSFGPWPDCTAGKGSFGTAPISATYTTVTMTISSPVPPGELLEFAAFGFSIGAFCAISPGQRSCTQTFPAFTVNAGDAVGAMIRRFNPSTQAFPLTEVSWAVY
jgi:hypothetical protein